MSVPFNGIVSSTVQVTQADREGRDEKEIQVEHDELEPIVLAMVTRGSP